MKRKDERRVRETGRITVAIFTAIISYFIAVNYGCWCGTATFIIILFIYNRIIN